MRFFLRVRTRGERSGWGARYQIGNFQMTTAALAIPHLKESTRLDSDSPCYASRWKRLQTTNMHCESSRLGIPHSQLLSYPMAGGLPTHALLPPRQRLKSKSSIPRWQQSARRDELWRLEVSRERIPEHVQITELLRAKGISSRESAHAFMCANRAGIRRCRALRAHNLSASQAQRHVSCTAHPSHRAKCDLCGDTAYFALDQQCSCLTVPPRLVT